jgi:hypothetical protein
LALQGLRIKSFNNEAKYTVSLGEDGRVLPEKEG